MRHTLPSPPAPGDGPVGGAGRRARAIVGCARPRQWTKNVLVFAAPGAAGVLGHGGPLLRTLLAFVAFCVVSSGTYFFNDALDAEADRLHPVKRTRAVAAGLLSPATAIAVAAVLVAGGVALASAVGWRLVVVFAVYVAVQLVYNARLKHVPVWDLSCVASGFVLRAIAGAVAAHVVVSEWFLIVATFGSLLMVSGKRLAEQFELGTEGAAHRPALGGYTPGFLRIVVGLSGAGAVVAYCLWAFDLQVAHRHHADPIWFELSIVPALIAALYYIWLVERGQGARPEELALTDRSLQLLGLVWVALFVAGVYGG